MKGEGGGLGLQHLTTIIQPRKLHQQRVYSYLGLKLAVHPTHTLSNISPSNYIICANIQNPLLPNLPNIFSIFATLTFPLSGSFTQLSNLPFPVFVNQYLDAKDPGKDKLELLTMTWLQHQLTCKRVT